MTELSYDFGYLDSLMDDAGLDVLMITSKHNVQYLLGGYRFIFFSAMDAIGHSRYLPVVVYIKGNRDQTAYIANTMEKGEHENAPFWVPHFYPMAWGSVDSITQGSLKRLKWKRRRKCNSTYDLVIAVSREVKHLGFKF